MSSLNLHSISFPKVKQEHAQEVAWLQQESQKAEESRETESAAMEALEGEVRATP